MTSDGGVIWEGMGTGLPNTLVLDLALGGEGLTDLYAAADAGPFGYDAEMGEWVGLLGTEGPLTTYWSVEWVPEIGVARFGTYGRGIWDFAPLDPAALTGDEGAEPVGLATRGRPQLTFAPSPARDQLTLRFRTHSAGEVDLTLFDITGRSIARLAAGSYPAGRHVVNADLTAHGLQPGLYMVRLSAPRGVVVRKIQVVH
jgi:hypothetical protein